MLPMVLKLAVALVPFAVVVSIGIVVVDILLRLKILLKLFIETFLSSELGIYVIGISVVDVLGI